MRTFYEEWQMLSGSAESVSVESNSFVPTNKYVIQDYDKPMGVATYKTAADMDERLKQLLPSVDELEKLL